MVDDAGIEDKIHNTSASIASSRSMARAKISSCGNITQEKTLYKQYTHVDRPHAALKWNNNNTRHVKPD